MSQSDDMNLTWWIKIDIFKSASPNLASSCARVDDKYRKLLSSLVSNGSSSLYSTIDDMSKWLLNFEEGTGGGLSYPETQ